MNENVRQIVYNIHYLAHVLTNSHLARGQHLTMVISIANHIIYLRITLAPVGELRQAASVM